MLTAVSQNTAGINNHKQNMTFGCKYCDLMSEKMITYGADPKKVKSYFRVTLHKEPKHITPGKITKHEREAKDLYDKIGSLKWGVTPYFESVLKAVSFMTTKG
ncbi:MAG: hypothetical protein GX568_06315 [Candidatus Gastranaerophilales bacterium]|nr:hypothetical protein [Candidatus Gastranaerophilales bacterium]